MISILFMLFLLPFSSLKATLYSMEDLKVLGSDESFEEFFNHALDIRPSERNQEWKVMVSAMGDSFSRRILSRSNIKQKDFNFIEKLFQWPALKTDDIFKLRRQEVGLRYLKKCLKGKDPCWDELRSFWDKDKTDPDTAFRLAELTGNIQNSKISNWTFLEVALKSPLSEFYCKKDFAMETLWGKIEMDYIKLGQQGDLTTQIDRTVHPDCLPSLIGEAKKRLFNPHTPHQRELAFHILKSQQKADAEITDFFYTVYLLDNPSKGELFNYSWNRVKELGKTAQRRERVLELIKRIDPLPDSILKSIDEIKKKVVLRHFKSFFPEYMDFYTDQCIHYYGGKGSFPEGNPTMNCQDFMNSNLAPIIIDDFKIKKYEKVRKI